MADTQSNDQNLSVLKEVLLTEFSEEVQSVDIELGELVVKVNSLLIPRFLTFLRDDINSSFFFKIATSSP